MFRRRLGVFVLLVLLGIASVGTAASVGDVAPQSWQPTAADVARTLRPCPAQVSAPTAPVCWSMAEDASAWMARPAVSAYGWGQCTYYVGLMRPDIWNDRAPPSVDPVSDWDAWTWAGHAQAEGLSVDGDPRPGDVMVWSRRAVGNDTGHVAIVDAAGETRPGTGELAITISEMNLDGLDDASLGQGDTMIVDLPRSQMVPGMVQFIHRPGPGYTAPGRWTTGSNPSLGVGVWSNRIATVSQSPAPVSARVTTTSGAVVKTLTLTANRVSALGLPTGAYNVCVSQPAAAGWNAASDCASAGWQAPVNATVSLGRPHRAGRRLSLSVVLGPTLPMAVAARGASLVAQARIGLEPTQGRGRAGAASTRTVYT
ncbi:MAG: CHAP domain-containing protein, partial [Solirubrobacteraceae bacterium]